MAESLGTLGSAFVQIVPSANGISGSIQEVLDPESKKAGKKAGSSVAAFAKKAIVAAGIGQALTMAITEGGALEQSLGGVETLFKNNADTVVKYADEAYRTAGLSANEYMETATGFAASLLQSLAGDTKAAAKYTDMAITDMSDNANKMGTDMELIQYAYQGFAKQNYTMLDNLKLGYGGTKSEMERLLADAEKLSGQEYDISNLSDVYDAIHVIQEELGITGTTAKEASETLMGSFSSMKSAAQNLLGNLVLGRNIEDSMESLAESASAFLFGNLTPAVGRILISLPKAAVAFIKSGLPELGGAGEGMIDELIDGIDKKLPGILEEGGVIVGELAVGFVKGVPKVIVAVGRIGMDLLDSIWDLGPSLLDAGGDLIVTFAKGIGGEAVAQIRSSMKKVKLTIIKPIEDARDDIRNAVNKIKSFFNITLKFKGIKLPHIDIDWKKDGALSKIAGKLGLPGVPDFDVSWYKSGGIFNEPSIIGLAEAGTEAVVPLDQLWNRFDVMADSIVNGVNAVIRGAGSGSDGNITLKVYLFPNGPKMGEYVVNTYDTYKRRLG